MSKMADLNIDAQQEAAWLFTNDELILIRECVRALDCGALHCRYCMAESPTWDHSEHCPYADSQRKVTEARKILDRLQRGVLDLLSPADSPQVRPEVTE